MAKKGGAQIQIQVILAFRLVLSLMRYLALPLLPLGKCSGDWVNTLPGAMALGGEPACGQVDSPLSQQGKSSGAWRSVSVVLHGAWATHTLGQRQVRQ